MAASQSPPARNQRQPLMNLLCGSLLLLASLSPCLSFRLQSPPVASKAVTRTTTRPVAAPSPLYASPLFRSSSRISSVMEQAKQQQPRRITPLLMTTDAEGGDKKEVEEDEVIEAAAEASSEKIAASAVKEDSSSSVASSSKNDDNFESGGVVRTILLAGPLFVKFAIVLIIKFATDLVVFPLLWLYRLARLTKRKFLKLIGRGGRGSSSGVNGQVNGSATMTDKEWKEMKPNGEQ